MRSSKRPPERISSAACWPLVDDDAPDYRWRRIRLGALRLHERGWRHPAPARTRLRERGHVMPPRRNACLVAMSVTASLLSACSSSGWHRDRRVPEPTPEAQAAATLDAFHRAAARADEVAYFGFFTEDAVF